jgi:hypothetical protein
MQSAFGRRYTTGCLLAPEHKGERKYPPAATSVRDDKPARRTVRRRENDLGRKKKKTSRCSIVFRRHHHHCGRSSTARIGSKDVVPDRPGACLVIEDRQGRWRLAYERTSIGPERPYGMMMMTAAVAAAWSILDLHNQTFFSIAPEG